MNKENENQTDIVKETAEELEKRRLASLYGPPSLREALSEEIEEPKKGEEEHIDVEIDETEETDEETVIVTPSPEHETVHTKTDPKENYGILEELARGLMIIFSPVIIPLFATILIFELSMLTMVSGGVKLSFTLIAFGICCVLPWLLILALKRGGFISDWQLSESNVRVLPYSFMFLALGGTALFFAVKGAPSWMWFIYIGGATGALLNLLINFKWKICCHATATAALVGLIMVIQNNGLPPTDLMWWEIGTILVAGLVGSACLITRSHTLMQVICGYITGFVPIILFSI